MYGIKVPLNIYQIHGKMSGMNHNHHNRSCKQHDHHGRKEMQPYRQSADGYHIDWSLY